MNPVDLYHDPSLDGLVNSSNQAQMRRQSSNRRRSNGNGYERPAQSMPAPQPNDMEYMPHAPEVPRGPPISYRGPVVDAGPQRSFSQRAKGRPFAREAFADVDDMAYPNQPQSPPPPRQSVPQADYNPRRSSMLRAPPPQNLHVNTAGLINEDTLRARDRDKSVRSATGPVPASQIPNGQQQPRRVSESARYREQPVPAPSARPSGVVRHKRQVSDDQSRDWAADRSPLQKLEVTLNDISKEEKRARVQEAEMILRESKTNQGLGLQGVSPSTGTKSRSAAPASSTSRRTRQPAPEPQTIEDAGLVRNLSDTHRQRLQHSTTIDSRQPDPRRLSGDGRGGFDYSPVDAHTPDRTALPTSGPSARRVTKDPSLRPQEDPSLYRSVSANAPEIAQSAPLAARARPGAIDQRNASHKAALAKLTGEPDPTARPEGRSVSTGSRKLQKPHPDAGGPVIHQPSKRAPSSTIENRNKALPPDPSAQVHTPPPKNRDAAGLSILSNPQTSSPLSSRMTQDGARPRQKTSSVTFKEPINRRPVDEWKDAQTARLTLADFSMEKPIGDEKYKTWWEQGPDSSRRRRRRSSTSTRPDFARQPDSINEAHAEFNPKLFVRCGPLLRYLGLKRTPASAETKTPETEIWRGSVMIVTQDSHSSYDQPPTLRLFSRPKSLLPPPPAEVTDELPPEYVDPIAGLTKVSRVGRPLYVRPVDHLTEEKDLSQVENDDGLFESSPSLNDINGSHGNTTATTNDRTAAQDGEHIGRYQEVQGARLYADPDRDVTFWRFNIEVELGDMQQHVVYRVNRGAATGFWVPARGQSMNIMFHSCNGFSLSVNPNQFSGPDPLWRDVLNVHQTRPFHVMIGGGDQIYNDRVMVDTRHFGEWTKMRNPKAKHDALFTSEMKEELETFYLNRYALWFSQGLFAMAGSQIPMVNIWDDHDIIDGFGSYPDHFMQSPVFSGLGNVAFKYYMLFQHQSVPEETATHEPSWVLGHEQGPYINQLSRNIFMSMGKHVAFLGVDCRTERMKQEILSVRTFDLLLEKCRKELIEGETKHLIVLLGVPIAYPRMVWLENVLTSRAMDPIKALGRAGVIKSGFLNKFDGGVEVLDDLDDHWTASHHKQERNDLIQDLQDLAAEKSVRITILGGDVHLAAIGQFHSNPKLRIPKDRDHRYMPNVISSAIVNTPPPDMLADVLNKRNKTHHLNKYTDETMIPMFTHDVDHRKRNNRHLLPRRNWCSIREYTPGLTPPPTPPMSPSELSENEDEDLEAQAPSRRRFSLTKADVNPRNLMRRLSSRNAPPSAYRDGIPGRSASYDGTETRRGFFSRGNSQRNSFDSQEPAQRASSADRSSSAPLRPGILRRPTNLSEKAAKKGNVPALDAEGNEIDVNDHINLEGGLDVVLNVEVNRKDPAGITTPYRLLIPALWYDGSSDREKLATPADMMRKPTLLDRIGFGPRRSQKAAQGQGEGNWGQEMSDDESIDSQELQEKQQPRRRFSLFGSRRRNEPEQYSDDEEEEPTAGARPGFAQPPQQTQRQSSAPVQKPALNYGPYDPASQQLHQTRVTQPPANNGNDALYDTTNRPPSQHLAQHFTQHNAQAQPQTQPRRSLTIGSQKQRSAAPQSQRSVSENPRQQPQAVQSPSVQDYPSPPPQQQQPQSALPYYPPPPSSQPPRRRLSKQERILGISSSDPPPGISQPQPQTQHQTQQHLRGNGIIGNPTYNPPANQGYNPPATQGYSGVDAYKEPNTGFGSRIKRGFSLKKARDWLDGRDREGGYDEDEGESEWSEGDDGAVVDREGVGRVKRRWY
jgi:hypothetical protein